MKVNYHILPNSIVVNFNGNTHNLSKSDHRFEQVKDAIKKGEYDRLPKILEHSDLLQKSGLVLTNGTLYFEGKPLPDVLNERVLTFYRDNLPFDYLIKFFQKLKKNPSYHSREMLYKFLEHNGHPITPDGNFIAYRGVTQGFKDCHTGTFDNSVGAVCEMDRSEVDDNPNKTCSKGLHVAAYEYAKTFGKIMVEVEVDPTDVVCVPIDYNGTKMRVSRFKVVNICKNKHGDGVYGDTDTLLGKKVTLTDEVLCNGYIYDDEDELFTVVRENADQLEIKDSYGDIITVSKNIVEVA